MAKHKDFRYFVQYHTDNQMWALGPATHELNYYIVRC